jgi:hypothetical protein
MTLKIFFSKCFPFGNNVYICTVIKKNEMDKKTRQIIFDKYNGKCAYCGCELVKGWHADHIEPIVRDSKWNRDKGRFEKTGTCRKPEN